jgi:hypothetical protein
MLAAVGKAHGDVLSPKSEQDRLESDDLLELLDLWNQHTKAFEEDVKELAEVVSKNMDSEIEKCVNAALIKANEHFQRAQANSPISEQPQMVGGNLFALFPYRANSAIPVFKFNFV